MFAKDWHEISLAERIHLYRTWLNLSMEELADNSGVSASYLSKIERGKSVPSVDILQRIAAGLKTTAAHLLSNEPPSFASSPVPQQPNTSSTPNLRPTVVRRDERKMLRPPNSAVYYELLTPDLQRKLEFTWVQHPPHHESPAFSHFGEESLLCLAGSVRVVIGDEEFVLGEGDCISFDSSAPHRVINDSVEKAILISVQTPASF
jgi:transcriptional regulator with XRE-family HTH domain